MTSAAPVQPIFTRQPQLCNRARLAAERRLQREREFHRQREEDEAELARRDEERKVRMTTFERILENVPATLSPAQLRILLRATVALDPYNFAEDLTEEIAGDNENEQRTAEEVLLSAIEATADNQLTRLVLTGHAGIPRADEIDFLAEAVTAVTPLQPKKVSTQKAKKPTPINTKVRATTNPTPNKKAAKKKAAAT